MFYFFSCLQRDVSDTRSELTNDFSCSSQPWPYPSSLMMGCWGIVKEGSTIRTDLDNELEGTVLLSLIS